MERYGVVYLNVAQEAIMETCDDPEVMIRKLYQLDRENIKVVSRFDYYVK